MSIMPLPDDHPLHPIQPSLAERIFDETQKHLQRLPLYLEKLRERMIREGVPPGEQEQRLEEMARKSLGQRLANPRSGHGSRGDLANAKRRPPIITPREGDGAMVRNGVAPDPYQREARFGGVYPASMTQYPRQPEELPPVDEYPTTLEEPWFPPQPGPYPPDDPDMPLDERVRRRLEDKVLGGERDPRRRGYDWLADQAEDYGVDLPRPLKSRRRWPPIIVD